MILVVGTGRSGTSTVARLLHQELRVPMTGTVFRRSRRYGDVYEDPAFSRLNALRLSGHLTAAAFHEAARHLITARASVRGSRWGFKCPATSLLLESWLAVLPEPCVIWCHRPLEAVVASVVRQEALTPDEAIERMRPRFETIQRALCQRADSLPMLVLDFSVRVPELRLLEDLRLGLERFAYQTDPTVRSA